MSEPGLRIDFAPRARSRWSDRGRPLGDGGAVLLAGLVVAGAWASRPVPLWVGATATGIALVLRRPSLLWAGGLLLGSCLGARAWAGLAPAAPRPVTATVTLVTDPETAFGSTSALVRHDGRRLELRAREGDAGVLGRRLAGEQVRVAGRIRPPPPDRRWLQVRHVVGRLDADELEPAGPGGAVWRSANRVRRTLAAGTRSLPPRRRALFNGLVLGDDRDQPATLADDFRGAGLSHLLAVSGQNVAFVLALLGPARRRLGLAGRWLTATAAIAAFALLTRFEPSVLRASFMAGLAVTATALGRPTSTVRLLALAVAALVLVDPLLVHSVGFQLSVAASAGIVLLSSKLAAALPGPSPLREALAVTLTAQLGVAPVLLLVFGGLPVAAVPANLLATPVAGVVVAWGLGAGLVAGVVSEPLAAALHLPTSASIGWIELVARRAATAPLGELGAGHVLAAAAGTGLLVLDHHRRRWVRGAAAVLLLLALVTPAAGLRRPPRVWTPLPDGSALWRAGGATALTLGGSTDPEQLLEALRRAGVRRVDVVISGGGGAHAAALVSAVRHRWRPASVLAPDGHAIPGAVTPPVGSAGRIGDLELDVAANRPRLRVRVRPARPP